MEEGVTDTELRNEIRKLDKALVELKPPKKKVCKDLSPTKWYIRRMATCQYYRTLRLHYCMKISTAKIEWRIND